MDTSGSTWISALQCSFNRENRLTWSKKLKKNVRSGSCVFPRHHEVASRGRRSCTTVHIELRATSTMMDWLALDHSNKPTMMKIQHGKLNREKNSPAPMCENDTSRVSELERQFAGVKGARPEWKGLITSFPFNQFHYQCPLTPLHPPPPSLPHVHYPLPISTYPPPPPVHVPPCPSLPPHVHLFTPSPHVHLHPPPHCPLTPPPHCPLTPPPPPVHLHPPPPPLSTYTPPPLSTYTSYTPPPPPDVH